MKKVIYSYLSLLLIAGSVTQSRAQKFTIPVFPDTQNEVGGKQDMFYSQVKWIVEKKDSLNIPIVLHVGDLVNFDNFDHYETASQGYELFDIQHIPYAIALGNHDTEAVGFMSGSAAPGNVNQNLRKTAKFNSYFPVSRFATQRGRYEADKSDNSYYTFKAGDTNWLVITLEFCPRMGAINWASDIARQYFNYNAIIVTHYYLTTKGEIGQTNSGYGDFSPQDIFDKLIKTNPNIRFVFSGHVADSAWKIDETDQGSKVYQILQDYQSEDAGGGYIRLLDFDIEKGTVSASMYSPYYKKVKEDKSKFQLTGIDFIKQSEERSRKRPE
ncbi:metallophosphoesterase [Dyadobacter alkalitolerans]|uniref:metallophosphoesterase n=1 Tax=Dyadobacter alkalitolerans TaxID=492736 RepID=UPI000403CB37|nr:metallophosphoesterase [Dyadobacter alkalitolerans]